MPALLKCAAVATIQNHHLAFGIAQVRSFLDKTGWNCGGRKVMFSGALSGKVQMIIVVRDAMPGKKEQH